MAGIGTRKQIKVVDRTPVLTSGEWIPGDTVLFTTWAEISDEGGNRVYQDSQTVLTDIKKFRIRWRDMVLSQNVKIIYQGRDWAIQSIKAEDEKKFYLIIRAK